MSVFGAATEGKDPRMHNLYFDVATIVAAETTPEEAALIARRVRQVGATRVLYGSDLSPPGGSVRAGWEIFRSRVPLSAEEFRTIAGNVTRFAAVAASQPDISVARLRSEPYSLDYNSGLDSPARLVVRDAETWRSLWAQIYRNHGVAPPIPTIDFSREMLVVAALGSRASGGYSIMIDGASAQGSDVVVTVRSISPGPKCGVTAALTQPVDVARMPRRDGPVRFVERAEVTACS
jgi:hypothetical protein